jgi:hypothetical protein
MIGIVNNHETNMSIWLAWQTVVIIMMSMVSKHKNEQNNGHGNGVR